MARRKTLTPIEELRHLQAEERALRERRAVLEQAAAEELGEVFKAAGALALDRDALVGGLLQVVSEVRCNGVSVEAWRAAGRRFRKEKGDAVRARRREVEAPS